MLIALRKAYRDLTRRRLRSMLTIIGIVIGVAGIVAITSTSKNMVAAQTAAYNNNSQTNFLGLALDHPVLSNKLRAIFESCILYFKMKVTDFLTNWPFRLSRSEPSGRITLNEAFRRNGLSECRENNRLHNRVLSQPAPPGQGTAHYRRSVARQDRRHCAIIRLSRHPYNFRAG